MKIQAETRYRTQNLAAVNNICSVYLQSYYMEFLVCFCNEFHLFLRASSTQCRSVRQISVKYAFSFQCARPVLLCTKEFNFLRLSIQVRQLNVKQMVGHQWPHM